MKVAHIGLFVIGVLTGVVATLYYSHSKNRQAPMPAEMPLASPAPKSLEGSHSPATSSVAQAPTHNENEPVDASIKTIPVKPEFEFLFKRNVNVRNWHPKLEKQPRDPAWAAETENSYRAFLLSNPDLIHYGVNPEVDCRTSICELRLLAYGADKATKWDELLEKPGSPYAPKPAKAHMGIVDWNEEGGVTVVYAMIMFRNRPDPNNDFSPGFSERP